MPGFNERYDPGIGRLPLRIGHDRAASLLELAEGFERGLEHERVVMADQIGQQPNRFRRISAALANFDRFPEQRNDLFRLSEFELEYVSDKNHRKPPNQE